MTSSGSRIDTAEPEAESVRMLVTGASGFAGVHLCSALREAGHEVVGVSSSGPVDVSLDVRDRAHVLETFAGVRPHGVFHLAAVAFVPAAERAASVADEVNRGGTANVLDGAALVGARTLVVSSGAVYGKASGLPVTERTEPKPDTVYAASKLAAERECETRAARQEIVLARPFNHTGPGQSREYVCSDFAAQVAECVLGLRPPRIEVGNLEVERDFSDVRDVVCGYIALFERGKTGEIYNLCSGHPTRVGWVLETLIRMAGATIDVVTAEERLRANEVSRLYGSFAKAEHDAGWSPKRDMETTLADLLATWRRELADGARAT